MQNRAHGLSSVRNCAQDARVPAAKPPSGKSFTIEALLAKPAEGGAERANPAQRGAQTPLLLPGHAGFPLIHAPYLCAPMWQPSAHAQPGYSMYCCPPAAAFQPPCRGAFYAQAVMPKVSGGFKSKAGKSKRMRTSFTSEQLSRLEKEFARQQYMVGSERFLLASALQLTEAQVKVWFQNRRIKWRKQSLEQQQAKLTKLGLSAPPPSPGSQGQGGDEDLELDQDLSGSDVDVDVLEDSAEV